MSGGIECQADACRLYVENWVEVTLAIPEARAPVRRELCARHAKELIAAANSLQAGVTLRVEERTAPKYECAVCRESHGASYLTSVGGERRICGRTCAARVAQRWLDGGAAE